MNPATSSPAPRVSIGFPVYNGQTYMRQALDSLLAQEFTDFEIVLCDNASTDDTERICREYAARDPRVRYHRNEKNIGAGPNYRRVFELARGEYFKWCAHDDVCDPRFLARCVAVMDRAPRSVCLVYPHWEIIDATGAVVDRQVEHVDSGSARPCRRLGRVVRRVSRASALWGLIRAEHLRKTQLTGDVAYWDEVLLVDLALHGQLVELPEVLFRQRSHAGNSFVLCAGDKRAGVNTNPDRVDRGTRARLRAWNDPSLPPRRVWCRVQEERLGQYLRRVRRARISWFEKVLCSVTVVVVGYWKPVARWGGAWRARWRAQRAHATAAPALIALAHLLPSLVSA